MVVTINELSDENVWMILKYGLVEDVVSKERYSTRFGSIANNILAKKTKFITNMEFLFRVSENKFHGLLHTIKKMKKLMDVTSLQVYNWENIRIKKLATTNQGIRITRKDGDHICLFRPCSLSYLEYVKELNPNYTGKGVQHVTYWEKDVLQLKKKYPEIDILFECAHEDIPINHDIGIKIARYNKLPPKLRAYVKHLFLIPPFNCQELSDFKKMESMFICFDKMNSFTFEMISPFIVSKLKRIIISGDVFWSEKKKKYVSTLSTNKLSGLKQLIDSHPLIELILCDNEQLNFNKVLFTMVLDSPMKTIKVIRTSSISIVGQTIKISEQFNCRDLLPELLNRFKDVYKVTIQCTRNPHDHDWIEEIFSRVVLLNKRRTFRVICNSDRHSNVKMIF